MNPRKAKLLEELPKNNWKVYPSAIKAGYSASYADKQPKKILKSALKAQAENMLEMSSGNSASTSIDIKRTLAETIGLSREDVYKRLVSIANQDKDLASALKILLPLSADLGVNLGTNDNKVIVPVLNIGVRAVDSGEPVMVNGSTEPINGSTEPPIAPSVE